MLIEALLFGSLGSSVLWVARGRSYEKPAKKPGRKPLRRFKTAIRQVGDSLSGRHRLGQQIELNADVAEKMTRNVVNRNRDIVLYGAASGVALAGMMFPLLRILSAVAVVYLAIPTFRFTWRDLKNRQISPHAVDALLIPALLLSGHILLAAIKGLIKGLNWKLIKQTEAQSYQELTNTFDNRPAHVWIRVDEAEIQVDFDEVRSGQVVIVQAGDIVPVDGVVATGCATIDQHRLTGESQPAEKSVGDQVFAATLVISGRLEVVATSVGKDVVASRLGDLLTKTAEYPNPQIEIAKKQKALAV